MGWEKSIILQHNSTRYVWRVLVGDVARYLYRTTLAWIDTHCLDNLDYSVRHLM